MLDSVSGPKPVCLQQVTVHLDLESLKLGRCWRSLQDGKRKGVPGSDSSVGECPEDRVIGAHRQGERELERMGRCQLSPRPGAFDVGQLWGKQSTECDTGKKKRRCIFFPFFQNTCTYDLDTLSFFPPSRFSWSRLHTSVE